MPRPLCPLCGFVFNDFDAVCPKCGGKGLPASAQPPQLAQPPVSPQPVPFKNTPARPKKSGIGLGIAIGLFVAALAVYLLPGEQPPTLTPTPTRRPVAAPLAVPTIETLPMSTPTPVATMAPTRIERHQSVPREAQHPQSTTEQLRGISFSAYGYSSFNAIRRVSTS